MIDTEINPRCQFDLAGLNPALNLKRLSELDKEFLTLQSAKPERRKIEGRQRLEGIWLKIKFGIDCVSIKLPPQLINSPAELRSPDDHVVRHNP